MQLETPVRPMTESGVPRAVSEELDLTFTPLHKRCLGVAVGIVVGFAVCLATLIHLARAPGQPYPLILLSQYLPGYRVTYAGALIGLAWGFWVGFVIGWCFAFARNLVLSLTAFWFRARAEVQQGGSFLDQL
jgi:hypothetical protein